jgi:hypothetical protein
MNCIATAWLLIYLSTPTGQMPGPICFENEILCEAARTRIEDKVEAPNVSSRQPAMTICVRYRH